MSEKTTETLDKLYLEWSQFTKAKTYRDIANEKRIAELEALVSSKGLAHQNRELREHIEALENDLSVMKLQNRYLRDRLLEKVKAEGEADET
jgi:hypothetical protein